MSDSSNTKPAGAGEPEQHQDGAAVGPAESRESLSSNESSSEACCDVTVCVEKFIEGGRNKHLVKCQFCPSKILNAGSGSYQQTEFELPKMGQKENKSADLETKQRIVYEQLSHFWTVPNMYSFENIGFSNTVGQIKYLACADCEKGPIGYYDMNSKVSYVALARVNHDQ